MFLPHQSVWTTISRGQDGSDQMICYEPEESRWFACGCAPRQEGVLKVAARLRSMAAGLDAIEPGLGPFWPQFEPRRLRPSDPGPLTALSDEELARLIDRRARADPPAFPAPVGPGGYHFALGTGRKRGDGVACGGSVWVENLRYQSEESVRITIGVDSAVWRSAETTRRILFLLVGAWAADWATATAHISLGLQKNGVLVAEMRPWMAWVGPGRHLPDSWVEDAGPPNEVRAERSGRLSTWPWPPTLDRPDPKIL